MPQDGPACELFLVEVRVADLPRAVAWYRGALGLQLLLDDPAGRFALLGAGAARIALKESDHAGRDRPEVRLTFLVADIEAERDRLVALDVEVGEPVENAAEGYREVRLADPDGTPIRLFAWTGPTPAGPDDAPTRSIRGDCDGPASRLP